MSEPINGHPSQPPTAELLKQDAAALLPGADEATRQAINAEIDAAAKPKRSRKKPARVEPRFFVRRYVGKREFETIWSLPRPGGPDVATMKDAIRAVENALPIAELGSCQLDDVTDPSASYCWGPRR